MVETPKKTRGSHDYSPPTGPRRIDHQGMADAGLTPDQRTNLHTLRGHVAEKVVSEGDHPNGAISPSRLRFVRFLAQQGDITDNPLDKKQ